MKKNRILISTLDNGGTPFMVESNEFKDNEKIVTVYKQFNRYRKVKELFDGNSDGKGDVNSCVLLRIGRNKYLFIGTEIYKFETDDKIEKFYALIGNSAVPYPVAVGKKNAYFMLDRVSVTKDQFNENINWADAYSEFYTNNKTLNKVKFKNLYIIENRVI